MHLVVLLTNPDWSIVRIKDGTIIYIRALHGHREGAGINPTLIFWERIPLTTYSTPAALPTVNQS